MLKALLTILIIACCSFYVPQNASSDQQIKKIAETQLPIYLAKITPANESDYGFTDQDNLEKCEVGTPYRLLKFNNDFYTGSLIENTNYLDIQNEWRVPVNLNGQSRLLLAVSGNPGNFTVSEMGDTLLAKELQEKRMLTEGENTCYLLRISLLSADLLVAEHDNSFIDAKFFPLSSAVKAIPAMGNHKKSPYSLDEVQQLVKDAVVKKQTQKDAPKKKAPAKSKKKKS